MQEFLKNLLFAVITAVVPVLATYAVILIRKLAANAAANTENVKLKTYIAEVSEAVAAAVMATNQTYVDALKKAGKFSADTQKCAIKIALDACIASISPAAKRFIEQAYGDLSDYLKTRIEAEVRSQKGPGTVLTLPPFMMPERPDEAAEE